MRAPRAVLKPVIFDASAVLALLFDERGADVLIPLLPAALVPAVNLAEAAGKLADRGYPDERIASVLRKFRVHATTRAVALASAEIRRQTRKLNFSLADRTSLATAKVLKAAVYTADRPWNAAELQGVTVVQFR